MKTKVDPLVAQGRRVFVAYSNRRAFQEPRFSWAQPPATSEFISWLEVNCGPRGKLWTGIRNRELDGFEFYFAVDRQALMFKLIWGGM